MGAAIAQAPEDREIAGVAPTLHQLPVRRIETNQNHLGRAALSIPVEIARARLDNRHGDLDYYVRGGDYKGKMRTPRTSSAYRIYRADARFPAGRFHVH